MNKTEQETEFEKIQNGEKQKQTPVLNIETMMTRYYYHKPKQEEGQERTLFQAIITQQLTQEQIVSAIYSFQSQFVLI
jgi:hypothetical protein